MRPGTMRRIFAICALTVALALAENPAPVFLATSPPTTAPVPGTPATVVTDQDGGPLPKKNKTILLILLVLDLGCCGVDRFYLGSWRTGLAKLFTCGGCGIWTLIDWVVIVQNGVNKRHEIHTLDMDASFEEDTIDSGYMISWMAIAVLVAHVICGIGRARGTKMEDSSSSSESDSETV
mmetsp:Transcript_70820/g.207533  ORF Transcript_70820/g.207533 Transcript_70820/m.207533 type:complete len:179 (-) Transcript_70820:42-578(-)